MVGVGWTVVRRDGVGAWDVATGSDGLVEGDGRALDVGVGDARGDELVPQPPAKVSAIATSSHANHR